MCMIKNLLINAQVTSLIKQLMQKIESTEMDVLKHSTPSQEYNDLAIKQELKINKTVIHIILL